MNGIKETTVYKDRIAIPSAVRKYFEINDGDSLLWCIEKDRISLRKTQNNKTIRRSDILYAMEKYGYEIVTTDNPVSLKELSPEDMVIEVLANFPEPRLIEGLPVIILNNKINADKLYSVTEQYGIINKVGYILDVCIEIAKDLKLKSDITALKKLRDKLYKKKADEEMLLINYKSDAYTVIAKKHLDPVLQKWNLVSLFKTKRFSSQFHKYCIRDGITIQKSQ